MAVVTTIGLERFWKLHGVALCSEAQGDGVPCPMLGRDCETCTLALQALYAQYNDPADPPMGAEPECGP